MVVIAGIAAAAAAAMAAWQALQGQPNAGDTIAGMRQQAGVLAALVNCVGAILDALMLLKRIRPGVQGTAVPLRPMPSFGVSADEL